MIIVEGLTKNGVFERIARYLMRHINRVGGMAVVLVLLCFFGGMLITNDVALITFVPLTLMIFSGIKDEKSRILTIVLETAAANLGSMLTPVGNPQNLYIYDHYKLTAMDFVRTMLPSGILSLVVFILLTLLLPKTACGTHKSEKSAIKPAPTIGFAVLFAACLLTVFRVLPDWVILISAIAAALVFDWSLLKKADYPLLATFVCFFVFVGNIARIEAVNSFFSSMISGREMIVSILLSQVISNVPAALMLSGFTDDGTELLLGVDLGGLGTIIASLASLISFQFYRKAEGAKSGRYLLVFTGISIILLIPLLIINLLIF
jgi:Na+/H+ antiporter NhaD/arsenite permease-like protein